MRTASWTAAAWFMPVLPSRYDRINPRSAAHHARWTKPPDREQTAGHARKRLKSSAAGGKPGNTAPSAEAVAADTPKVPDHSSHCSVPQIWSLRPPTPLPRSATKLHLISISKPISLALSNEKCVSVGRAAPATAAESSIPPFLGFPVYHDQTKAKGQGYSPVEGPAQRFSSIWTDYIAVHW